MFFRISQRSHDGLMFASKLAARYATQETLTILEAAGKFGSAGYLEQVVTQLRDADLVKGRRGPGGGYVLSRSPEKISVREVVEAIEGKIALVACQEGECPRAAGCGSQSVWHTLQSRIAETLEEITLDQIAEKQYAKSVS